MRRAFIVFLFLSLSFIGGCGPSSPTRVIGGNGTLSASERADVRAAVAVAKKYTRAWVSKDYDGLYQLHSPCTMERTIPYKGYLRVSKTWREKGILQAARPEDISYAKIASSFDVISGISDTQAMIEMAAAVSDDGTADRLRNGTWPERSIFLRHTIGNGTYAMILVKDNDHWSVMCAPGQLDLESSGLE